MTNNTTTPLSPRQQAIVDMLKRRDYQLHVERLKPGHVRITQALDDVEVEVYDVDEAGIDDRGRDIYVMLMFSTERRDRQVISPTVRDQLVQQIADHEPRNHRRRMLLVCAVTVMAVIAYIAVDVLEPGAAGTPASFSDQDVVQVLQLAQNPSGVGWRTPDGCDVAVVLNTSQELELYSGDTVATNPSRTAGVKLLDPSCVATVAERLRELR